MTWYKDEYIMYEYLFFDLKVYFLILILKKLKPSMRP